MEDAERKELFRFGFQYALNLPRDLQIVLREWDCLTIPEKREMLEKILKQVHANKLAEALGR